MFKKLCKIMAVAVIISTVGMSGAALAAPRRHSHYRGRNSPRYEQRYERRGNWSRPRHKRSSSSDVAKGVAIGVGVLALLAGLASMSK